MILSYVNVNGGNDVSQRDIEAQQDALMDDMVVVLDRMKDQSEGIGTRLHTHQE